MTGYKITSHEDYQEHQARLRRQYAQAIREDARESDPSYGYAAFLANVAEWMDAYHNQLRLLDDAYSEWADRVLAESEGLSDDEWNRIANKKGDEK